MKKVIPMVSMIAALLVMTTLILYNYFSIPDHVRNAGSEEELVSAAVDPRIESAVSQGREFVFEGEGLDIPFNISLLNVLQNHFECKLKDQGMGMYQGEISSGIALELLLKSDKQVGQIQLILSSEAKGSERIKAIEKYVRFINVEITAESARKAADSVEKFFDDMQMGSEKLFLDFDTGFGVKKGTREDILYIP